MSKIVDKIINYILERRRKKLEKTMEKLKRRKAANSSTTKMHMDSASTLTLSMETEQNKEKVSAFVKNIVKQHIKNPDELLTFIEEHGTKIYRLESADKLLAKINEEEGFISPKKGLKGFYLNFITGLFAEKKLVFKPESKEMFVLRPGNVNIYYMMHQFHKWFSFKENLPGFDFETQEKFQTNLDNAKDSDFQEMSLEELVEMKEAIARDSEAVDFVIDMVKESEGAKKAFKKIEDDGSASI